MDTQEQAATRFMPIIEAVGIVYEKFTQVQARPAVEGEVIITTTAAGKETQNTAKAGDFVVKNLTKAQEQYILPATKFTARYKLVADLLASKWATYQATGECKAVPYTGTNTEFMAPWGEPMQLHTGDMICTPLPQKGEVYRIAAQEFSETYRPKS